MTDKTKGFLIIYRSLQDHWLWDDKPFSKGQAWIDLLIMANFRQKNVLVGRKIININPGTVLTSITELSKKWGWGRKKASNFLDILHENGMITLRKGTNNGTIITIENYTFYQNVRTNDGANDGANKEQTRNKSGTNEEQTRNKSGATFLIRNNGNNGTMETREQGEIKTPAPAESRKNNPRSIKGQTNKTSKKTHGALGNVKLLDSEVKALKEKFPDDWEIRIDNLSYYMGSTGKTYKSHYLTILNWARKDQQGQIAPESAKWNKAKAKAGIARPAKSEEEEKMWKKKMLERSRGRSLRGGRSKEKGEEK